MYSHLQLWKVFPLFSGNILQKWLGWTRLHTLTAIFVHNLGFLYKINLRGPAVPNKSIHCGKVPLQFLMRQQINLEYDKKECDVSNKEEIKPCHQLLDLQFVFPLLSGKTSNKEKYFLKIQPSEVFFKIVVLKNSTNFTGKHLCWSLFLIIKLKRDSNTGVFL